MYYISYFIILFLILIILTVYRRYYPVKDIHCINKENLEDQNIAILDIRNYHDVTPYSNHHILNIPYEYLKRFYLEIPLEKIHIIATDRIELNLGVRFLRRKGICIYSYELATCTCK
nr:sulfurtransferase [Priestia endophytica]